MGAFSEMLIENPDFHIDGILIEDAIYDVDVDEVGCFIVMEKEMKK